MIGQERRELIDMALIKKLLRYTRTLLHRLFNRAYHKMYGDKFFIFWVGGCISIFIDSDHLISEPLSMARPLHIPIFIVMCIVVVGYGAHLFRHVHNLSVGDKK